MAQRITAVYEEVVLRPVSPLELPDPSRVEIDILRVASDKPAQAHRDKLNRALMDAGLSVPFVHTAAPPAKAISAERREELARLFSSTRPISELISDDRERRRGTSPAGTTSL